MSPKRRPFVPSFSLEMMMDSRAIFWEWMPMRWPFPELAYAIDCLPASDLVSRHFT